MTLTAASLFVGGPSIAAGVRGAYAGFGALSRKYMLGFAGRVVADVAVQGSANYISASVTGGNRSFGAILGDVNLIETVIAGIGVSPFAIGTTSAAFQYSVNGGLQTTLDGGVTLNQFVFQSAIGTGFGHVGQVTERYLNPSLSVGIYMHLAQAYGQRLGYFTGLASFHFFNKAVPHSIGTTEEYLEGKAPE